MFAAVPVSCPVKISVSKWWEIPLTLFDNVLLCTGQQWPPLPSVGTATTHKHFGEQ
jgi:hypothetical protein